VGTLAYIAKLDLSECEYGELPPQRHQFLGPPSSRPITQTDWVERNVQGGTSKGQGQLHRRSVHALRCCWDTAPRRIDFPKSNHKFKITEEPKPTIKSHQNSALLQILDLRFFRRFCHINVKWRKSFLVGRTVSCMYLTPNIHLVHVRK
jgi:hypothetical protein